MNIVNKITNEIISRINPNWNKLQKIRYVYISLGKILEKNTDFFLSDKFKEINISPKEIYDNNIISERNINNITQYQVICKSASLLLKTAFDKLDIVSSYVHCCSNENGIHHWLIVAQDDSKQQYFLTLASDLPYIKNNLPTQHFAGDIKYIDKFGSKAYELPKDKNIVLSTEGIAHVKLRNEQERINFFKSLDESIGYYTTDFSKDSSYKELSKIFLEEKHEIFQIFNSSFGIDKDLSKKLDSITKEEVENFKLNINKYISNKLKNEYNIEADCSNIKVLAQQYINAVLKRQGINNTLSFNESLKKYHNELSNYDKINKSIKDLINIEESFDKFIILKNEYFELYKEIKNDITQYHSNNIRNIELEKCIYEKQSNLYLKEKEYENVKKFLSIQKLTPRLHSLVWSFIENEVDFNNYIPTSYIADKLTLMLPTILEFNTEQYSSSNCTNFSNQSYSEQIVIIKELLRKIFSELNEANCKDMNKYNNEFGAIENRIQTIPLKNKITGEYCILFSLASREKESTGLIQYIYIPSKNSFEKYNLIKQSSEYFVLSNRFRKEIEATNIDLRKAQNL